MRPNLIYTIYKDPRTVFTLKDFSLLFPEISYDNLRRRAAYLSKTGRINNLKMGIYVKENYDPGELGNRLYTPSYVSLETVLVKHGLIFQYYEAIFYISYLSRRVTVGKNKFYYHKITDKVLYEPEGVIKESNVWVATPERAFLDAVFLYGDYYFDNLSPLNWDMIFSLAKIYDSPILERRVKKYYGARSR